MMKKLLLVSTAIAGVWFATHRPEKPKAMLFDRPWLDHLPRSERETVQVFFAFDDQEAGNYVAASRWQGKFEGFRFEADGAQLHVEFPQSGDEETLAWKVEACHQPGFDLCLELDGGSRGVHRYFSRKDWRIRPGGDPLAAVFE